MKTIIKIENIRCSGCSGSIGKEIGLIAGVYGVNFDIANKTITIDHTDEIAKEELVKKFESMGYFEEGSQALISSKKSIECCPIGEIS